MVTDEFVSKYCSLFKCTTSDINNKTYEKCFLFHWKSWKAYLWLYGSLLYIFSFQRGFSLQPTSWEPLLY